MIKIELYREDNEKFIVDDKLWRVTDLEGFDFVNIEIGSTSKTYGDGAFVTSKRIGNKDRSVKIRLTDRKMNENQRNIVRSFFRPKSKYKLFLTYQNVTKWCEGELYAMSMPTGNIYNNLEVNFTLLCSEPYLLSVDNHAKNIGEIIPRFGFPFVSLVSKGFIFSEYRFDRNVVIRNNGDVQTNLKIELIANGEVKNPIIKKDDKFIRILDTMKMNDTILIDLEEQPTKITKNGLNIFRFVDRESSFIDMPIEIGINTISYDAEMGSQNLDVNVYYYERYTGV